MEVRLTQNNNEWHSKPACQLPKGTGLVFIAALLCLLLTNGLFAFEATDRMNSDPLHRLDNQYTRLGLLTFEVLIRDTSFQALLASQCPSRNWGLYDEQFQFYLQRADFGGQQRMSDFGIALMFLARALHVRPFSVDSIRPSMNHLVTEIWCTVDNSPFSLQQMDVQGYSYSGCNEEGGYRIYPAGRLFKWAQQSLSNRLEKYLKARSSQQMALQSEMKIILSSCLNSE